jgi:hypothetical protein
MAQITVCVRGGWGETCKKGLQTPFVSGGGEFLVLLTTPKKGHFQRTMLKKKFKYCRARVDSLTLETGPITDRG